jgi:light-regulated signal transduction histidine kinase (bacteriophytochrome)
LRKSTAASNKYDTAARRAADCGKGKPEHLQVSENIGGILEKPATEVAGTPLSDYITAEQTVLLQERFAQPIEGKIPITFSFTAHGFLKKFLALVQAQADYYIMN